MKSITVNDHVTIHYHDKFIGDVLIERSDLSPTVVTRVPMYALDTLFAERIRMEKIAAIESKTVSMLIRDAVST